MNSKQEEQLLVFLFLNIHPSAKNRNQSQFMLFKHILLLERGRFLAKKTPTKTNMQAKGGKFVEVYLFPLCITNCLPNKSDWGTETLFARVTKSVVVKGSF